jgi:sterol 24-C-methyltransferase
VPTNKEDVIRYYQKTESRIGYDVFLRGTKHFGYFRPGDHWWAWSRSLRQMEDELAIKLSLPAGAHVLDAGCGMGDVAARLALKHQLNVTGIDILEFNIDEANKRAKRQRVDGRMSFRILDYSQLDFPDASFDGAYTMETLVHAAEPEIVLRGFLRVLRPGGRLVLVEYAKSPDREMPLAAAAAYRYVNEVAAMPAFQQFEYGVLEGMLTRIGFENVEVVDVTKNMLPMLAAFAAIGRIPYDLLSAFGKRDKVINAMSAVEFWRYREFFRYNIYVATKPTGSE